MSQIIRKILNNPPLKSSFKFISTIPSQTPSNLPPPFLINTSFISQINLDHGGKDVTFNPNLPQENAHLEKFQIYPSFSFGYVLNPICPSGSGLIGPGMDQDGPMWADSVKKKRKKKMNKHKYKKLRKRLRRKTKT